MPVTKNEDVVGSLFSRLWQMYKNIEIILTEYLVDESDAILEDENGRPLEEDV